MTTRKRSMRLLTCGVAVVLLIASTGCQNVFPRACFSDEDCIRVPINGAHLPSIDLRTRAYTVSRTR